MNERMAEGDDMAIRILRTIQSIFKRDPELQEFTIIPTNDNTKNKSPVLYEHHNIGLESWCVKHVYQYASTVLFESRESLRKGKLTFPVMEELNTLLIGVILMNADVSTFWNMKRELVERDILAVEEELYFSKIVLTHKSKCNEVFGYRRWLLKRIINKMSTHNLQIPLSLLQNEFFVINLASEKSPNNYHSWNHRIWCMENIVPLDQSMANIVYSELSYSQEWINNHVSEYAGYHYRQYLIKLIKDHKRIVSLYASYYNYVVKTLLKMTNDGDCSNLLIYLLGKANNSKYLEETCSYVNYVCVLLYDLNVLVEKLNDLYPEHESLFYHRKYLVYSLVRVPYEYHGLDMSPGRELCCDAGKAEHSWTIVKIAKSRRKPRLGNTESRNLLFLQGTSSNVTSSDAVLSIKENDVETNKWPKLFKLSPRSELYNLYTFISASERTFASKNTSPLLLAKYRKWLTHVVGFE